MKIKTAFVAIVGLLACLGALRAEPQSCDISALGPPRVSDTLLRRAATLRTPEYGWPDPEGKDQPASMFAPLSAENEVARRGDLARGLETFPVEERPILLLMATSKWTEGDEGLLTFIVMDNSVYFDPVVANLNQLGLAEHAGLVQQAMDLFGSPRGLASDRLERLMGPQGPDMTQARQVQDHALNDELVELSKKFAMLPRLGDIAVDRIAASPELASTYAQLPSETPDDVRLYAGLIRIANCMISGAEVDLKPIQREGGLLWMLYDSNDRGGFNHYFGTASGNFAVEAEAVLRGRGYNDLAAIVEGGILIFGRPYPQNTANRNAILQENPDAPGALDDPDVWGQMRQIDINSLLKEFKAAGLLPG